MFSFVPLSKFRVLLRQGHSCSDRHHEGLKTEKNRWGKNTQERERERRVVPLSFSACALIWAVSCAWASALSWREENTIREDTTRDTHSRSFSFYFGFLVLRSFWQCLSSWGRWLPERTKSKEEESSLSSSVDVIWWCVPLVVLWLPLSRDRELGCLHLPRQHFCKGRVKKVTNLNRVRQKFVLMLRVCCDVFILNCCIEKKFWERNFALPNVS